jgi:hypothetical protein
MMTIIRADDLIGVDRAAEFSAAFFVRCQASPHKVVHSRVLGVKVDYATP